MFNRNGLRKIYIILVTFVSWGCGLAEPRGKSSSAGLIVTPSSYYSTAKARSLAEKHKERVERLALEIVRNSVTNKLQFANNIVSSGGIGFFTHSGAQSPDERYLEVVLGVPEVFDDKTDFNRKVDRLFSAYGPQLLSILARDTAIYDDPDVAGYGLNLSWRATAQSASGSRVTLERVVLYTRKEDVARLLNHLMTEEAVLSASTLFALETDKPARQVAYRRQTDVPETSPLAANRVEERAAEMAKVEVRPAIQEKDLASENKEKAPLPSVPKSGSLVAEPRQKREQRPGSAKAEVEDAGKPKASVADKKVGVSPAALPSQKADSEQKPPRVEGEQRREIAKAEPKPSAIVTPQKKQEPGPLPPPSPVTKPQIDAPKVEKSALSPAAAESKTESKLLSPTQKPSEIAKLETNPTTPQGFVRPEPKPEKSSLPPQPSTSKDLVKQPLSPQEKPSEPPKVEIRPQIPERATTPDTKKEKDEKSSLPPVPEIKVASKKKEPSGEPLKDSVQKAVEKAVPEKSPGYVKKEATKDKTKLEEETHPIKKQVLPKGIEGYFIQATFAEKGEALRWAELLGKEGYTISMSSVGETDPIRLRLGGFSSPTEAKDHLRRLQKQGFNGIVLQQVSKITARGSRDAKSGISSLPGEAQKTPEKESRTEKP